MFDGHFDSVLDAAREWARQGRAVFPCHPATKAPLVRNGVKEATTDPDTLARWWTARPDALIGMACGDGVAVVDLDIDPATGETVGLNTMESAFPDALDAAIVVGTPSGGTHLWFEDDDRLRNWVKVLPGVDVRTTGGYVILPPSPGYEFKTGSAAASCVLGPMPPALIGAMLDAKTKQDEDTRDAATEPASAQILARYAKAAGKAMIRECSNLANTESGSRNDALNTAAFNLGQLVGAGALDAGDVRVALTNAASDCGLTGHEVTATITSGLKSGSAQPRDLAAIVARWDEDAAPEPTRALKLYSVADCANVKPPNWIVKGVVAAGNLFPIYAPPKSSKSFLALDMAWHIATGDPWFGKRTTRGGALVVCAERLAVTKRRLAARVKDSGRTDVPVFVTGGAFALHEAPQDVQAIIEAGREVERRAGSLRLIVVDTFAKACAGADDVSDMPKMLAPITQLQEAFPDAVICPIHHTSAADTEKLRGRTDFRGAIDGALLVRGHGFETWSARLTDSNDAADEFEPVYGLRDVQLGIDEDGEPFKAAVVEPRDKPPAPRPPVTGKAKEAFGILRALIESEGAPVKDELGASSGGVALEVWRDACVEHFEESASSPNAARTSFSRAKQALLKHCYVADISDHAIILDPTASCAS